MNSPCAEVLPAAKRSNAAKAARPRRAVGQDLRQLIQNFKYLDCSDFVAAGEGFEPSQTESESVVLPLHNPAIFLFLSCPLARTGAIIRKAGGNVNSFFKIF